MCYTCVLCITQNYCACDFIEIIIMLDQKYLNNVRTGVSLEIFALNTALGPFRTNFNGELEAIRVATE